MPAERPDSRAVRDFMGEVFALGDSMVRADAKGWVVLVLDCDSDPPKPVMAYGPFAEPEQALADAGRRDADQQVGNHPNDGSPGWKHVVLPMYESEQ